MASALHEPITRVWGRASESLAGSEGRAPWSGGEAFPKLKDIHFFDAQMMASKRHPRRRKMRHRNPQGPGGPNKEVGGQSLNFVS